MTQELEQLAAKLHKNINLIAPQQKKKKPRLKVWDPKFSIKRMLFGVWRVGLITHKWVEESHYSENRIGFDPKPKNWFSKTPLIMKIVFCVVIMFPITVVVWLAQMLTLLLITENNKPASIKRDLKFIKQHVFESL